MEVFQVLYPTPIEEQLTLVSPALFTAGLNEPTIAGDTTSSIHEGALPPYLVYGADGDVTGELVYVNFGMPDDYAALASMGVDVKGKIVIARYGGGWRGLKVKLAQVHAAIGCIIYSDPADDGYGLGDVYPKGGWRPDRGVQRGSVVDELLRSGDPLTPNIGAVAGAKRLDLADTEVLMKIPALPISYADAQPFLAALSGQTAPRSWRGALPITYHVGPGPARVHLTVKSDWSLKPLYDVIAVMHGHQHPDEWVIHGNHRDAWVFGAWDPLSGQTAMLEEAKAIGTLAKTGWRPNRTIMYASWDGEEPGLLGSTEWAEQHADELTAKAILYINTDETGRGFLNFGGSYSAERLINQAAAEVPDPETGVSAAARAAAAIEVKGAAPDAGEADRRAAKAVLAGGDVPIGALGTGSDFTPFLQHLGVASVDLSFSGEEEQEGVYHSQYDTFDHYVRFGDPGLRYEVSLAETAGRLVLRTADAELIPLHFTAMAEGLANYVEELRQLAERMRDRSTMQNQLLDQRAYQLTADPRRASAPPPREDSVPTIDLSRLDDAVARLKTSADAYDQALAVAGPIGPKRQAAIDTVLIGVEHALTDPRGLPGRSWYKHLVYAPGLLTGYGAKTLPGVREAIEARRWAEGAEFVGRTAKAITRASDQINRATTLLKTVDGACSAHRTSRPRFARSDALSRALRVRTGLRSMAFIASAKIGRLLRRSHRPARRQLRHSPQNC
jgi:N-acetylated-alpha-linked acidic dipeptidase